MDVSDQVTLVPLEFLEPVNIYTVFSKKSVNESTINKYNQALEKAKREINYLDYIDKYQTSAE
jgi:hypothetical protein